MSAATPWLFCSCLRRAAHPPPPPPPPTPSYFFDRPDDEAPEDNRLQLGASRRAASKSFAGVVSPPKGEPAAALAFA